MNRHERRSLRRLERSGLATLEAPVAAATAAPLKGEPPASSPAGGSPVFAVEPFFRFAREAVPLFERHWRELALDQDVIPLELDFDRYLDMSATGMLHVVTARNEGTLIGYIFNLVGPHLHYKSTIHAELEMFYLDPAFRAGWFPVKMFRFNDEYLRSLGVVRVGTNIKRHFMGGRVGLIFERLGYKPVEVGYWKVL